MKIRHLLFAFFVFAFTLAAAMTAMTMKLYDDLLQMEAAEERRFASYCLAEELRRSSDDLAPLSRRLARPRCRPDLLASHHTRIEER